METSRVDVGRHFLALESCGSSPPDFICLHGLCDSRGVWGKVLPDLAARGRVVLVDQRAHGDSDAPAPPYDREDLAADVLALLDRFDIPQAIVIGHSMGGIVAMTLAIARPERVGGLVLIGTTSQVNGRTAQWYEKVAAAAESDGLNGLRRAIFGEKSSREIRGDAGGIAALTRCLRSLHDRPLTPHLTAIRCPTALLVGDRDPMGAAASEIIARTLPDASLEVVPGGHWLHLEAPDRVVVAVDRVLREVRAVLPSGRVS